MSEASDDAMMLDEAVLRVYRGGPASGAPVDYRVPIAPGMVVLDALHSIQAQQAPDLAVRWNCKAGKCGSCSAEINGMPRLMCMKLRRRSESEPGCDTAGRSRFAFGTTDGEPAISRKRGLPKIRFRRLPIGFRGRNTGELDVNLRLILTPLHYRRNDFRRDHRAAPVGSSQREGRR